jgi:hypothetical protein
MGFNSATVTILGGKFFVTGKHEFKCTIQIQTETIWTIYKLVVCLIPAGGSFAICTIKKRWNNWAGWQRIENLYFVIVCNDPDGDGPIKNFPSIYASSTFQVSWSLAWFGHKSANHWDVSLRHTPTDRQGITLLFLKCFFTLKCICNALWIWGVWPISWDC